MPGNTQDLLVELYCEPIPAKALKSLIEAWPNRFQQELLVHGWKLIEVRSFGTLSRIGLHAAHAEPVQSALEAKKVLRGPSKAQAQTEDGQLTAVAQAWATRNGVLLEESYWLDTPSGCYLAAQAPKERVRPMAALIPEVLEQSLTALSFPKRVYWDGKQPKIGFLRPIRNILCLWHSQAVSGRAMGCELTDSTPAPRWSAQPLYKVQSSESYFDFMKSEGIRLDFGARQAWIEEQASQLAASVGGKVGATSEYFEELAGSAEAPCLGLVPLGPLALSLPAAPVQLTLTRDLRALAVVEPGEGGRLCPYFLCVTEAPLASSRTVLAGYANVLEARLKDVEFFYRQDLASSFSSWNQALGKRALPHGLGSLGSKQARLTRLAAPFARWLGASSSIVERAAQLCKADLSSQLVSEMPELAGEMGAHYASVFGESPQVCRLIRLHECPRSFKDPVPSDLGARALSLANHFEHLIGLVGVGQAPRGNRDPYGLRRSALSVLRILLELPEAPPLGGWILETIRSFPPGQLLEEVLKHSERFLAQRLHQLLVEAGHPSVRVSGVIEAVGGRPFWVRRRLEALQSVVEAESFPFTLAAYKRVAHFLSRAGVQAPEGSESMMGDDSSYSRPEGAPEGPEWALWHAMDRVPLLEESGEQTNYSRYWAELFHLAQAVEYFFDQVFVMGAQQEQRLRLMQLLSAVSGAMIRFVDLERV